MLSSQHAKVLSLIESNGSQSLEDLHKLTGYHATTIRTIVEDLKRMGKVQRDWSAATVSYKLAESHILVG